MQDFKVVYEEFKVLGKELVEKVGELIREGNVRRIIVKDEKGNTFIEIPLTVATVGVIAAPVLAALGTIAALIAHFTIGVERVRDKPQASAPHPQEPPAGTNSLRKQSGQRSGPVNSTPTKAQVLRNRDTKFSTW